MWKNLLASPALLIFLYLAAAIEQTNVLFIMFDDLRVELPAYDRNHVIAPNFDRLAARSVIFDKAIAQIAVCNPSRDSMLTGLRPDTVGTYGFQSSFRPHLTLPTRLGRMGYNTAGVGKVVHWETDDRSIWNYDNFENNWYEYQTMEVGHMNSSNMPDKVTPETEFRDYVYTSKAIQYIRELSAKPEKFMVGIGFKLPHLAVHVPFKYYELYKNKSSSWRLTKKELRYPFSNPDVSYRCCAEDPFRFMNQEGALPSIREVSVQNINAPYTEEMHDELMMSYCGAITFLDVQLGRLWAVMDELSLWDKTTVVLTADHGMHNGEKGIWEKWSMFDEATRVPLFISHPKSPFHGKHYTAPVELLDIFPTLNDILGAPYDKKRICISETMCLPLQGKSLANAILGEGWNKDEGSAGAHSRPRTSSHGQYLRPQKETAAAELFMGRRHLIAPRLSISGNGTSEYGNDRRRLRLKHGASAEPWRGVAPMVPWVTTPSGVPHLEGSFAISQSWRCAKKDKVMMARDNPVMRGQPRPYVQWFDCDKTVNPPDQISVMGYSMRSDDYRYTIWFHYDRTRCLPILDTAPFEEELYDHRGEKLSDFTHLETVNLAHRGAQAISSILQSLRERVIAFVKTKIVFRGCFK